MLLNNIIRDETGNNFGIPHDDEIVRFLSRFNDMVISVSHTATEGGYDFSFELWEEFDKNCFRKKVDDDFEKPIKHISEYQLGMLNSLETEALCNNYKIISRNDDTFELVYEVPGTECNHLLHGLLSLFTLVWLPVWIYKAYTTIEPRRVWQRVERSLIITWNKF